MFLFHWFQKVFRRAIESRVWRLRMYGFDFVDITFGFISIIVHMLDHNGFCELEIVDFALVL